MIKISDLQPITRNLTGADFSGTDGDANRTYTIPESTIVSATLDLVLNGLGLHDSVDYDYVVSTRIITILLNLFDADLVKLQYSYDASISISSTSEETMRWLLIQQNDSTILPDALCQTYLVTAQNVTGITETNARIYYACYLLAKNWESLKFVTRFEGTSFKKPDPQEFLNMYTNSITTSNAYYPMAKQSVDPKREFDSDNIMVKKS